MSRYPYTIACDLIRDWAGYDDRGSKLSRSDASAIQNRLAEVLGMDPAELAKKLADYSLAKEAPEEAERGSPAFR